MEPTTEMIDVHEAIYMETNRMLEEANAAGFKYPYTLELHQNCSGYCLIGTCVIESMENRIYWNLRVRDGSVAQPLTISLWAEDDTIAKSSRTFQV